MILVIACYDYRVFLLEVMILIRRLFCYIEYNKIHKNMKYNPSNYDLLEIGAILYVDDEEVKTYSRFIHPQYMELMTKERYLSFGGLKQFDLENASSIEDISRRFYKTFYEYDLLVMWSRKEYEILMASLKRGGHVQAEHKAIFLEELIKMSKGYSKPFLSELKAYKVNVDDKYNLHYSKYKAKYLAELYFAAKKSYSVFLKREDFWFMKSCCGNVVHKVGCSIGKKIPIKYVREASIADLFDGYEVCDECCKGKLMLLPDRSHVRYPKKSQFEEEQIAKMCEEFGMKYTLSENIVFVKTQYSSWRVFHDGKFVLDVYHENLRLDDQDKVWKKDSFNEGFHKQRVFSNILYDVLYYIHNHDRDFFRLNNRSMK